MKEQLLETVTQEVLRQLQQQPSGGEAPGSVGREDATFVLGISNRHLHLSREHMDVLFGPGSELTPLKPLRQPGQFAARESLTLVGPRGSISGVRVVGPLRQETQVEIARTDGFVLGIEAPVRVSGDLKGSAPCVLTGPRGMVLLDLGVIVAQRHVHLEPDRARTLDLKDRDVVRIAFDGEREGVLGEFVVRVGSGHLSEVHLDTDEANAVGARNAQQVTLIY